VPERLLVEIRGSVRADAQFTGGRTGGEAQLISPTEFEALRGALADLLSELRDK